MKRFVPIALVLVAVVILVRRLKGGEGIDWETLFAKMPDDAPPKWMFNNITAIRENTEKLLERTGAAA